MNIRELVQYRDLEALLAFYEASSDFWFMAQGALPDRAQAIEFFQERPTGRTLEEAYRWGLFEGDDLVGVTSFYCRYPEESDAFISMFMISAGKRRAGRGRHFLAAIEQRAHAAGMRCLNLCVFEANMGGVAFWPPAVLDLPENTIRSRLGRGDIRSII